ncbi:sorting nexin-8-like, partial [Nilaparvata lugens]|uniref:sorting nexin-8-like n=1 Tax=Nilaparvata lugens TaxID=108931 RepID=UPI00193DD420
ELVPPECHLEFGAIRDQICVITNGVSKIKHISDLMALRSHSYSEDMSELGTQLHYLYTETNNSAPSAESAADGSVVWPRIRRSLGEFSTRLTQITQRARQQAASEEEQVCDELATLLDVLGAHRDLCERVERGVADDHQRALSRMLALKKRQIQGVLRGTD